MIVPELTLIIYNPFAIYFLAYIGCVAYGADTRAKGCGSPPRVGKLLFR